MIVLASRSPRRAELLSAAGIEFTVRTADVDETPHDGETPDHYVQRLAEEKALAVTAADNEIVLGADTTVVLGSVILGKPADEADAMRMLSELAGRKHEVITGICLRKGSRVLRDCASTAVWFAPMCTADIDAYVKSGEPMDKAGAYGIQGLASKFVERIDGSYSNVVGLPVALVYQNLRKFD